MKRDEAEEEARNSRAAACGYSGVSIASGCA
jgi:hypothetical protein